MYTGFDPCTCLLIRAQKLLQVWTQWPAIVAHTHVGRVFDFGDTIVPWQFLIKTVCCP
jgi:hypothetical protein